MSSGYGVKEVEFRGGKTQVVLTLTNTYMLSGTKIHNSWRPVLAAALQQLDKDYLAGLTADKNWLPGPAAIFNAFSSPLESTKYVLFGESPYPRRESANGCAFWDAAVHNLWADTGLSKQVNRATSLRNLMKMMLVAKGKIQLADTSQGAIAALDKTGLAQTLDEVFANFQKRGFLLLNATPVLRENVVRDAKEWRPFISSVLTALADRKPKIKLVLLGNIAKQIAELPAYGAFDHFTAEHPYNISFISNPQVLGFFKDLDLLATHKI